MRGLFLAMLWRADGGIGIGFFVWDEWNRLNVSAVFLAIFVIGLTGLILDYALATLQTIVTRRSTRS